MYMVLASKNFTGYHCQRITAEVHLLTRALGHTCLHHRAMNCALVPDLPGNCVLCSGPRTVLWRVRPRPPLHHRHHAGRRSCHRLHPLCQAADSDEAGSSTASNRLSTIIRQGLKALLLHLTCAAAPGFCCGGRIATLSQTSHDGAKHGRLCNLGRPPDEMFAATGANSGRSHSSWTSWAWKTSRPSCTTRRSGRPSRRTASLPSWRCVAYHRYTIRQCLHYPSTSASLGRWQ